MDGLLRSRVDFGFFLRRFRWLTYSLPAAPAPGGSGFEWDRPAPAGLILTLPDGAVALPARPRITPGRGAKLLRAVASQSSAKPFEVRAAQSSKQRPL